MGDWPKDTVDLSPFGVLSTASEDCMLADFLVSASGSATYNSTTFGLLANSASYVPVVVRSQVTVYQLGWVNGGNVAGNLDVGIYDRYGNRLVSSGSTPQATISVPQLVDIADTTLAPDFYYLALAGDNPGTQNIVMVSVSAAAHLRPNGLNGQTSAFPLPPTATFTPFSSNTRTPLIFAAIEGPTI